MWTVCPYLIPGFVPTFNLHKIFKGVHLYNDVLLFLDVKNGHANNVLEH